MKAPGAGQQVTKYYFAGTARIAQRRYTIPQSMAVEYFLGDHLGSTSITTDANGAKVSEMRYTPWGEVRYSWKDETLTTTPVYSLTRYSFTGQYSYVDDPTTPAVEDFGLIYFNARWVDTQLGHFVQADSIIPNPSNIQDWGRYTYARNNPVRYNDPSGHCPWCIPAVIAGAVVGVGIGYGIQVYENYQSGIDNPWTTSIDPDPIVSGALIGAVAVAAVGVIVAVPVAAPAAAGVAACADGDCGNEVTAAANGINKACGGDFCASEIEDVSRAAQASTRTNQFWTKITQSGATSVYQRPDLVDPSEANLARMQNGRPPIGPDGLPVQLHHMLQTMDGSVAEVTATFHRSYSSIIHINPNTIPSGIDRAAFAAWRAEYWIERARGFLNP